MKRPDTRPIPLHDYGSAIQTAVSWLGERYLLAEPVSRRREERSPFFSEPRSWHTSTRKPVRH
jgi:hypothetical protein